MEYFLIGIAAVIIIIALMYFRKLYFSSQKQKKQTNQNTNSNTGSFVNCPLCNSPLVKGQNIISKVYRPMDVYDQLCTIYGCPNCYPICKPNLTRTCPVCHKTVSQNGYLISRLFNKTKSGTKHVIINGCGECNKRK